MISKERLVALKAILSPILVEQNEDKILYIRTKKGLDSIAAMLSNRLGGTFMLGSASIAWVYSRESIQIAQIEMKEKIESARELCAAFTGEEAPYSVAACSRKMFASLGLSGKGWGEADRMIETTGWHCLVAKPGKYENMSMFDMKGAYWQMALRAPSPFVNISDGRISFLPMKCEEREKWEKFKNQIAKHKLMRNSLVGSLASAKSRVFSKGDFTQRPAPRHPLRHFALAIVATCYEICSEAAVSTGSVYSHTDCVVYAGDKVPGIWGDVGISADIKASGETEIISIGNRKVGEDETEFYGARKDGIRFHPKAKDSISEGYRGLQFSKWLWNCR